MTCSDVLTRHQPTPDDLDDVWTVSRREEVLRAVMQRRNTEFPLRTSSGPSRPQRRVLLIAGVAAAAVTALALPVGLAGSHLTSTAAAAQRLADTAAEAAPVTIGSGQYLYTSQTHTQGSREATATVVTRSQTWTAADGTSWRVDDDVVGGRTVRNVMRLNPTRALAGPLQITPSGLRSWPTDPTQLTAYIEARVVFDAAPGTPLKNSGVADALHDALLLPTAPPALRSGAIRALADLPGSRSARTATQTQVGYPDTANPGRVTTLTFENDSARIVLDVTTGPGTYVATAIDRVEVRGSVPADVRRDAVLQGNEDHPSSS